jgi:hypothetical protein
MHAVQTLANAPDLTKVPLQGILGPAVIMTVSMTASATRGRMLSAAEWETVKGGCEAAKELKEDKEKVSIHPALHCGELCAVVRGRGGWRVGLRRASEPPLRATRD